MSMIMPRLLAPLLLSCSLITAGAQDAAAQPPLETGPAFARPPTVMLASGRRLTLFPATDVYPKYFADPHERAMALRYLQYAETDIPETGASRLQIKLGGRLGLFRIQPGRGTAWQANLEAGFDGQFDNEYSQDNIGWDGHYGAHLTSAIGDRWSVKLGTMHLSSHVGDEYAERTGRRRLEYTREEVVGALAYSFAPASQAYAEAGYAYKLREFQEAGRAQVGLQHERPARFWFEYLRWYLAANVTALEERAWRADWSLAAGLRLPVGFRHYRLEVMWYDGRPTIGEFFQSTEQSLSLGLWLDL